MFTCGPLGMFSFHLFNALPTNYAVNIAFPVFLKFYFFVTTTQIQKFHVIGFLVYFRDFKRWSFHLNFDDISFAHAF